MLFVLCYVFYVLCYVLCVSCFMKKVVIAMSGGVDSSVAAKLLVDQGYEVVGIFLHFWTSDILDVTLAKRENKCCSTKALMDARRICTQIGIKLYTLNFKDVFKREIVDNFLNEYSEGRTPNPCVRCNKFVKLGLLIQKAQELGFEYVATGHYVISQKSKVKSQKYVSLVRAKDMAKDQSYFLYALTQEQLSHLIFPLGSYSKEDVRKMARKFRLPVADKSESQEICFIPGKSHNDFLKKYLKLKKGSIKTIDGLVVGEHQGLPLYTIGQRKGIEIGGIGPFYAAKMDCKKNVLYVVQDKDDPVLYSDVLTVKNANWIKIGLNFPLKCEAVIRYHAKAVSCEVDKEKNNFVVRFIKPVRAITPGQSVVFYDGDEVLGGGVIDQ